MGLERIKHTKLQQSDILKYQGSSQVYRSFHAGIYCMFHSLLGFNNNVFLKTRNAKH